MAYTSLLDKWHLINPREERLPYDLLYDKAMAAEEVKALQYLDYISSTDLLLQNDPTYSKVYKDYNDKLNLMTNALSTGDLRTARMYGNILADKRKLQEGQKIAEHKADLIKQLEKEDSEYAFSKRYSPSDALSDMDKDSSYSKVKLSDYRTMGASLGKSFSQTLPEEVGSLFNGAIKLYRDGHTFEEVQDYLANSNSTLSLQINNLVESSGITDEHERLKVYNAVKSGVLSTITSNIEKYTDPTKTRSGRGGGSGGSSSFVKPDKVLLDVQLAIHNEDFSNLAEKYPEAQSDSITDLSGQTHTFMLYGNNYYGLDGAYAGQRLTAELFRSIKDKASKPEVDESLKNFEKSYKKLVTPDNKTYYYSEVIIKDNGTPIQVPVYYTYNKDEKKLNMVSKEDYPSIAGYRIKDNMTMKKAILAIYSSELQGSGKEQKPEGRPGRR